jgi:hypothetical protein
VKLVTTLYACSHGWPDHSWSSMKEGVKVSVEVHSNVEGSEECATCRCLYIHTNLSFQPDQPFILQLRRCFEMKLCILSSLLRN